ncbi:MULTISPECIES: ABC transporter permease [unclassified Streptomyces]|uniref:ABC transporter permease n=1 Tax=unclassified Streptomyces TaxID=2593676 RepID=UPI00225693DD|nr:MULTISPECIES: ABC transporter permease [unclassified Streptomyces]MCX4528151.1 ABC transporter permease [Streptomyces sp. NBC_01551]MCX4541249.1 ABC transporter permease [Streptomyces sp. NBC_01565]
MTGPAKTGPATSGPTTTADRQPGYSSPLPTTRPHLGHALASEWTKLTSVRSTVWTLSLLVVTVVGIGLLFVVQTDNIDYSSIPFTTPAIFGLLIGQLSVMVLGVLTMTSEHGTGLIRTTFTAAPERHRVLTAKYIVFSFTAFLATSASVFVVTLAATIVHSGPGSGPHSASEWTGALLGSLYVTLLGVLALALGALLRHSAGAIAAMIGLVTLPPVIGAVLSIWEAGKAIGNALLQYNAPVALMQLFGMTGAAKGNDEFGAVPGDAAQMTLILVLTGAAVAASYVVVGRRDV